MIEKYLVYPLLEKCKFLVAAVREIHNPAPSVIMKKKKQNKTTQHNTNRE